MSQIVQQGALNTTALVVPGVYVQILAPNIAYLNGVPTNVVGFVGVASWGPVNSPQTIGSGGDITAKLGAMTNRSYDLATACSVAIMQGCNNMRAVRISDGTDVAATTSLLDAAAAIGAHITAIYTGILGNIIQVAVQAGSATGTTRVSIQMPGQSPELFDNIVGTGAALWANIVSAINNGVNALRGPSKLVVATIGVSTAAPALSSYTLASGTDGTATVTTAKLIGIDGALGTRTGMYALRGTGASVGVIVDCYDPTSWTNQLAYGLSEGTYMVTAGAPGQTPVAAAAAKATAGVDGYDIKILLGDWCYFNDNVNGVIRLLSPATFYAGLLGNLAPQNSGLNKQVYGIVATQSSQNSLQYSSADLQTLVQGQIDVIANPCPGGSYFGPNVGHNGSSNAVTNGDNYTRMTNYLAATLAAGMGQFVGYLQSSSPTDDTRAKVKATIDSFLQNMVDQKQIDSFSTKCDLTNNPDSRVSTGYLQVDVSVKYLAVVEKLLVNLMGGQSVQVARLSTTPTATI